MSAISAVWVRAAGMPVDPLRAPLESALEKYGPDCQRAVVADRVAVAYCGLHTLPEDRFDTQPLWSPDRSVCLVADVRLDNRSDLVRELQLAPAEELADSAILMSAWLRWGSGCLEHLIGGFAFAVWTPAQQQLFAARDHTGERPLFYCQTQEFFALCSTTQGLLALPGVPREIDESHIAAWIAGLQLEAGGSFYKGIHVVPPGHLLSVTPERFECKRYWHPLDAPLTRFKKNDEYAESMCEILDRAVEARLRSIKPVGSLLSSGLDSGSVTASAALLLGRQGKELTAFTSIPRPGFTGRALPGWVADEAGAAAEVCGLYPNIDHVLSDSRGKNLIPTMKSWIGVQDEPPGNAVNKLWFSAILDRAQQHGIGVMLEGAYGNLTISWSTWSILGNLFRRGHWLHLTRTIRSLHAHDALSVKTALRYSTRGLVPASLVRHFLSQGRQAPMLVTLLSDEWMRRFNVQERIFDSAYNPPLDPREEQAELFGHYDYGSLRVANEALTGIQLRDPTADRRIYEFCFSIPQEQYLAEGHSRSLIRRAMLGRLPDSVRLNYRRGLQAPDWNLSVAEALPQLRQDLPRFRESPLVSRALNLDAMQKLVDEWPTSGFDRMDVYAKWHTALVYAVGVAYFLLANE